MKIHTVFYCLVRRLHKSRFVFSGAVLLVGNLAFGGAIHEAADIGDLAKVKALIKADADSVFSRDQWDFTPLHRAAREDRADVAGVLLANKAKINAKDNEGMTPLHWAALYGCTNVAKVLLANKANVEAKDNLGMTPLHRAAVNSEAGEGVAILLLALQAQVNVKDKDGMTPLQIATMRDNDGVVRLLLGKKAKININAAVAGGDLATVTKLLTENPKLIFKKGLNDWTVLHEAAMHGQTDVAALLLAKGAEVNAEDIINMTPLHCAATRGYTNVAKLLLDYKADVNAGIGKNGTPLHEAAMCGHIPMAQLLLANGTDVNTQASGGATPLQEAAVHGQKDMVSLLLANGADINAKKNYGATALSLTTSQYLSEMDTCNDPKYGLPDNALKIHLTNANNCKAVIEFLLDYMALRNEDNTTKLGQPNPPAEDKLATPDNQRSPAVGVGGGTSKNMMAAYALDSGGKYPLANTMNIVSSNAPNVRLIFTTAQPLTTNGLMFSMEVSPGVSGHIQVSTNLITWKTLTSFSATNSTINFCDPGATNAAQSFYRAIIP